MTEAADKLAEIDRVIADFTAQRKALAETVGQELVGEVVSPLLAFPGVTAVSWTQYTPYFNDGDPCEFSVNWPGIQFGLDPDDDEDEEYDGSPGYDGYDLQRLVTVDDKRENVPTYYQSRPQDWYDYVDRQTARRDHLLALGVTAKSLKELGEELQGFQAWLENHEDFLEDAFGDHVRVTFRRNGAVDVDEYSHN